MPDCCTSPLATSVFEDEPDEDGNDVPTFDPEAGGAFLVLPRDRYSRLRGVALMVEMIVSIVNSPCLILSTEWELEFTLGRETTEVEGLNIVDADVTVGAGAATDAALGSNANLEEDWNE